MSADKTPKQTWCANTKSTTQLIENSPLGISKNSGSVTNTPPVGGFSTEFSAILIRLKLRVYACSKGRKHQLLLGYDGVHYSL